MNSSAVSGRLGEFGAVAGVSVVRPDVKVKRQAQASVMTAPSKMAHVVFRTNQIEKMKAWYCTVLEAKASFENEQFVFLTYDDEHHRVAIIANQKFKDKPGGAMVGFHHAAFTHNNLTDLFATYERLRDAGIRPVRAVRHGPTLSFYFRDPDGNDIELQVDRFERAADAVRWMRGEAFANNSIGFEFNPEDVIAQYRAGASAEALMRRPDE